MTSQPGQSLTASPSICTSDRAACAECGSADLSLMIGGRHSGQIKCGACSHVGLPIVVRTYGSGRDWLQVAREAVTIHRAIQDPAELGALLGFLAGQVQPLRVVEIGGAHGGSAWAWLQLPSVGQVVTVDLYDDRLRNDPHVTDPRHVVVGHDSTSADAIATVQALLGADRADLVFIDGGHDLLTVTQDWHNYAPLCSGRGVIAFHDILPWDNQPTMEVHKLWHQISRQRATFDIANRPDSLYGIGVVIAG